jgi:hypothetical protein
MADDSALGKYRAQFADRLGMIEEYPSVPKTGPGFGGATKIIDSQDLLLLLNADATQHVDARTFLAARLTDFLINDNDRHPGNWKWARLPSVSQSQWEPIARDRDHAFVSYEGILIRLARSTASTLVSFGKTPNVEGLTQPRGFDARLLAGLEKPVWDSVARAVQERITDAVIHAATHAMPVEYHASIPRLEALLKERRAALPNAANQFYRLLAARVEIHATDSADHAIITRAGDGLVDVRLEARGKPFFTRRFDARETAEILVYLHGGDDTALVTGQVSRSIKVRIIGGNGTNTFVDSSMVASHTRPTRLYDVGTVRDVSYGLDTLFDRHPWENTHGMMEPAGPEHGGSMAPVVGLTYERGIGITPRIGVVRYTYGFDRRPYASMVRLEGEYASKIHGARIGISADKRLESTALHFTTTARMSDLEVVNFSGLGNATIDSGEHSSYFDVRQRQWRLHPAIALAVGTRLDLSLGPVFQHSTTDDSRSRYLSIARPYGVGTFNQAGLQLDARYDWIAVPRGEEPSSHRVLVEASGFYVPAMMDVRTAFEVAAVAAGASLTIPLPTHPLLVVRAGGKKLYGEFPFFEAATIGGDGTTRYMDTQRYAGDASIYSTSELRIPDAQFQMLIPWRVGVIGLAEAGRVYVDGASPDGWHSRTGEGVWFGRADAPTIVTITRTTEPGHAGLHVRLGLTF